MYNKNRYEKKANKKNSKDDSSGGVFSHEMPNGNLSEI
jgi:hypothetical protein